MTEAGDLGDKPAAVTLRTLRRTKDGAARCFFRGAPEKVQAAILASGGIAILPGQVKRESLDAHWAT